MVIDASRCSTHEEVVLSPEEWGYVLYQFEQAERADELDRKVRRLAAKLNCLKYLLEEIEEP